MPITEYIATAAILISLMALLVPYLTYRRERKKSNQDIVFQEKIVAYKEICFRAHEIYINFFDLVDKVQFYEGNDTEWENIFREYSGKYYKTGFDFKKKLFEYVTILPNDIFKNAEELSENFLAFVTTTIHCDNESTIHGYEYIGNHLQTLIDLIRTDLNVNKLNVELSKRIE